MDIHSWIMSKSITESNKINESYSTRLFSYVSSTVSNPKLRIMYLFPSEMISHTDQSLAITAGPEETSATNIINAISQRLIFTV